MKRNDWKYLVDTLMFVSMLGIVVVGLLLAFVIPRGSAAPDAAKFLLGLHRHYWGNIHLCLSLAFTAFVTVHILLNWEWVKCMARKIFKRSWVPALALTAFLSIVLLVVLWALSPRDGAGYGKGKGEGRGAKYGATEGNR